MGTHTQDNLVGSDNRRLRVIHVAGTKGKGSTAAFCEAILRQHGQKTGLYTSPHLKHVRERIRVRGVSISEHAFARTFFALWRAVRAL